MKALSVLLALLALVVLNTSASAQLINTPINGPAGSEAFGTLVVALPNGNFVVTDPLFDLTSPATVADVGAVFLYSPSGTLLNKLTGSQPGDQVGTGISVLSDGNYVVRSPNWDDGGTADVGAVTWCSASGGADRVVTSSNSLVGSTSGDQIGSGGVTVLTTGRYLVRSPLWDNGGAADAGAATWCVAGGTTVGTVTTANSLAGSTSGDNVPSFVRSLDNGSVLVLASTWDNGASTDAGAAMLVTSLGGATGEMTSANALVGSHANDQVGTNMTALTNSNVVVASRFWNGNLGAITWINGSTGLTGEVSDLNSLVGQVADDFLNFSFRVLTNGNYVIMAPNCDIDGVVDAGAVTWCSGTTGRVGNPASSNSLVGTTAGDQLGSFFPGTSLLNNGNYIVCSPNWDDSTLPVVDAGAVTWCDGSTGRTGPVSASNSLIGSTTGDLGGGSFVYALSNGNFVVTATNWDNGGIVDAGAITWCSGTAGIAGAISASNSLVGSTASDGLLCFAVALTNGNYIASWPNWDNGTVVDVGAAVWCNGSTGRTGAVSAANALVGSTTGDKIGQRAIALSNGNYVVSSPDWNNGATLKVGAVVWCDGAVGRTGIVSPSNALIGTTGTDAVGNSIRALQSNGNYVVFSSAWQNGSVQRAGAVTWCDGLTGRTGIVSTANSLVGSVTTDFVGSGGPSASLYTDGSIGFRSTSWDDGANVDAGAFTLMLGNAPTSGLLNSTNSVFPAAGTISVAKLTTTLKTVVVGNAALNVATILAEPPNAFAFNASTYLASESAGVLNVTINRSGNPLFVQTITLNTGAGTATANGDYRPITNQVLNFGVGVTSLTVPVTILAGNALNEPNESFTLALSAPTNGSQLGGITSAVATIVETNTNTAGAPTITSPAASAVLDIDTGNTTTISGSATDTDGVSSVEVSLNGGAFTAATLTPPSGTNVNWSLAVTPTGGRNDVFVRYTDAVSSVSPIASRSFIVRRKLNVSVTGPGTVTSGFVPNSFRLINSTVSLTAKANAGALFNNWSVSGPASATAGITQAMLDQPTLNVVFREGLTLAANFAANPFTTANTGTFNGLVTASATLPDRAPAGAGSEDGTTSSVSTEGSFSITLLPAATFTGKISIDGLLLSVSGSFDANGIAHFGTARSRTITVPRTGKPSLRVSDVIISGTQISGKVSALDFAQNVVAVSDFTSHRAAFNAANPVSSTFLGAASAPQLYTCLLPYIKQASQIAGNTAQTYPQGDGIGTITLTKLGAITAALTLADGTTFTSSTTADALMNWRLFAPLYSNKGYLQGSAQFNLANPDTDVLAAIAWRWTKPQDLTKQHYPVGWTHLKVNFLGAKYANTAGSSVLKALGGFDLSPVDPLGNAMLDFFNGQLGSTLSKLLNVSTSNTITKIPATDSSFTATIAPGTGKVTGTFTHTDGTVPSYQAVILKKGANAGAHGFFMTVKPKVIDFTGESGEVQLTGH